LTACRRWPRFTVEDAAQLGKDVSGWEVIPHFVDPARFAPATDRQAHRRRLLGEAVPDTAPVVLAVGDLAGQSEKRLDWVVRETASVPGAHLVVAGQATAADIAAFEQMARPLLGGRLHLRPNVPPAEMPNLYPDGRCVCPRGAAGTVRPGVSGSDGLRRAHRGA
jgi:glycosyltransferase involved in cell wall biosynthesis